MSQVTLHIFMNSIENTTRVFKEAAYTLDEGICTKVAVIGLWQEGLAREETNEDGLDIIRHPTLIKKIRPGSFAYRTRLVRKFIAVFSLLQYAIACVLTARRLRADHVSCHNAFMLPVSWAAARLSGATLEYLPHELEVERAGLSGIWKRLIAMTERRFIRAARNVVVVNQPIRDWYEAEYGLRNLHVVRNVPERDTLQFRPIPEGGLREKFAVPDTAKLFIYQGMITIGRGIEDLIEIFARLDPAQSHVVFMGFVQDGFQHIMDEASARYPNVHYQPGVPREWIMSYSSSADVGIFVVEDVPLNDVYCLPNKFFEWTHSGLPVLVSNNMTYLSELVEEGEFGWSCPFEKVDEAVRQISKTDLSTYSENARRFAVDAVWEEDAKAFADVYRPKGS